MVYDLFVVQAIFFIFSKVIIFNFKLARVDHNLLVNKAIVFVFHFLVVVLLLEIIPAVLLLAKRYGAAPHAENLYALAEAMELAGQTDEAEKAYAEFERKSLAETNITDNSNHELIAYYADHAHQPEKALEVAQREIARRHDVFTLDCYAWALAANGEATIAA